MDRFIFEYNGNRGSKEALHILLREQVENLSQITDFGMNIYTEFQIAPVQNEINFRKLVSQLEDFLTRRTKRGGLGLATNQFTLRMRGPMGPDGYRYLQLLIHLRTETAVNPDSNKCLREITPAEIAEADEAVSWLKNQLSEQAETSAERFSFIELDWSQRPLKSKQGLIQLKVANARIAEAIMGRFMNSGDCVLEENSALQYDSVTLKVNNTARFIESWVERLSRLQSVFGANSLGNSFGSHIDVIEDVHLHLPLSELDEYLAYLKQMNEAGAITIDSEVKMQDGDVNVVILQVYPASDITKNSKLQLRPLSAEEATEVNTVLSALESWLETDGVVDTGTFVSLLWDPKDFISDSDFVVSSIRVAEAVIEQLADSYSAEVSLTKERGCEVWVGYG